VGLVGVQALGDKNAFQIAEERRERTFELRQSERCLIGKRAENPITNFVATAFKENHVRDYFLNQVLHEHSTVVRKSGGDWWRER
jgi:hypothetical protein